MKQLFVRANRAECRFKAEAWYDARSVPLKSLFTEVFFVGQLLPFRWQPFIEAGQQFQQTLASARCCHFDGSLSLRPVSSAPSTASEWLLPFRWQPFIEAGDLRAPKVVHGSCCHFDGSLSLRRPEHDSLASVLAGCCHFDGSLSLRPAVRAPLQGCSLLLPFRWQPFIEASLSKRRW